MPGSPDTRYPLQFWKVVAAVNASNKLFATAYVLDQRKTIEEYGQRGVPQVPFTPYKTFQSSIAGIEQLTGLRFATSRGTARVPLSNFDPLHSPASPHPASRGFEGVNIRRIEIQSLSDVVLA